MSELSILGLYNWDNSIFNNMCFPGDFTADQKQNIVDNILMECAELEILYPDPKFMKKAIAAWSFKELPTWVRIYNAALAEYNPIENYRRNEQETISSSKTEEHSGTDRNVSSGQDVSAASGNDRNVASGTDQSTGTTSTLVSNTNSSTVDHKVTGYDSNALVEKSQDSTSGTVSENNADSTSGSVTYGKTDTLTYGKTDTTTYGKTDALTHGETVEHSGEDTRSVLAYGNIGVTTSQEMLKQELEIAGLLNIGNVIVDSFKNRFCILVY